jgi:hypothetical protein
MCAQSATRSVSIDVNLCQGRTKCKCVCVCPHVCVQTCVCVLGQGRMSMVCTSLPGWGGAEVYTKCVHFRNKTLDSVCVCVHA